MLVRVGWLVVGGLLAAGAQVRYADTAARELVERSRQQIAQDRAAGDLRSLLLKGRLRKPAEQEGETLDGQVEIRILLPDRFLRIDTIAGNERRSGFTGRTPITSGSDLRRERAQVTRLMLGLAAWVSPGDAIVVKSTGETAFADTSAVDLSGPSVSARLVFDAASSIPLRVVYFTEGGVSTVVSFANRRLAGGLNLPFRVTTQTPDRVLETLMFDEIVVNPDLTESDFKR